MDDNLSEWGDEARLLNTISAMPDGVPKQIIDLCYNYLSASIIDECIAAVNALPKSSQSELLRFMIDDGKASYRQRYGYICQYFRILTTDETTTWIRDARTHVAKVAAEVGCERDSVVKYLVPLGVYRRMEPSLFSTREQEHALLVFLSTSRMDGRANKYGIDDAVQFLHDRTILELISEHPARASYIYELCEIHGKDRGFVVKDVIDGVISAAVGQGEL